MRTLTVDRARRIAVRAQLLEARRPTDLLATVEHLTFLQLDPVAAVAPAADLVSWSRLGGAYAPADLDRLAWQEHRLFEYGGADVVHLPSVVTLRPVSDLRLYLPAMRAPFTYEGAQAWWDANAGFRSRVVDQLRAEGPLLSKAIPDTAEVPWRSTGWTNNRNVNQLLELMARRGVVAVAGRVGRQRLWDLAERVFPSDVEELALDDALAERDRRRLRALGIARPRMVGDAGEEVAVEGVDGVWRVDPDATDDGFEGRAALLSPFDRLIHDRERAMDLFGFEYLIEMYKPKEKRRWGYFALPVLLHDRLVGKLDATADRKAGVLRVDALHEDVRLTKRQRAEIDAEIASLATWLGLEEARP
ncbi:winged helix-turn-helix domain-containing protein [Angustibacter speluncae]